MLETLFSIVIIIVSCIVTFLGKGIKKQQNRIKFGIAFQCFWHSISLVFSVSLLACLIGSIFFDVGSKMSRPLCTLGALWVTLGSLLVVGILSFEWVAANIGCMRCFYSHLGNFWASFRQQFGVFGQILFLFVITFIQASNPCIAFGRIPLEWFRASSRCVLSGACFRVYPNE